jgi:hypothetical protein
MRKLGVDANLVEPRDVIRLKNDRFSADVQDCDPSSNTPDVGILSCGLGYNCVANEASSLGGFCISTSRGLQETDSCDFCEEGFGISDQFVGMAVAVNITGYENATCGGLKYASYANDDIFVDYCSTVSVGVQASGCCASKCTLCPDGTMVAPLSFTFALETAVAGFGANSTCKDLAFASYGYVLVDEATCPTAASVAEAAGCCIPIKNTCQICENESEFQKSNNVEFGGSDMRCFDVQPFLDETQCSTFKAELALACCEVAAVEGTSGAASLWSTTTTTLVSMMGFVVVTAAGALWM